MASISKQLFPVFLSSFLLTAILRDLSLEVISFLNWTKYKNVLDYFMIHSEDYFCSF